MKNNKLVSVIIPTYGGSEYIIRSINSVLRQSYNPVEIIIVDDNGLNTPKQIKTASALSIYSNIPSIHYVCHEVNKNGSTARNTGVQNSHGEYIALLDDDDEFYPEKIGLQVNLLEENPEYGLTFCSSEIIVGDKVVANENAHASSNYLYDLLMHNQHIQTSSILMRRAVWDAVGGFDTSFKRHQDWEFLARLSKVTKFLPSSFVGYRYYIVQRNRPQDPVLMKELRLYYLEKMKPVMSDLTESQKKVIYYHNRLCVAYEFLKRRRFREFIKEYQEIAPGFYGVTFLVKRTLLSVRKVLH